MALARRPRASRAGHHTRTRGPHTPRKLLESGRAAPTAGARVQRPLWPLRAATRPPRLVHGRPDRGAAAALRRCCGLRRRGKRRA